MNAPADQKKNEEGGMLVAALAGGAILLAIALVMFSGGDEAEQSKDGDEVAAAVDAKGKKSGSSKSSFQKRKVDDATRDGRSNGDDDKAGGAPAAVAPAAHRSSRMAVGAGMQAPGDVPKGPPEFESKEDEVTWWNRQLDGAKMLKKRRVQALEKLDESEKKAIANGADPDKTAESFGKKREGLEEALQRSEEKIAEIEKTISEL